MAVNTSPEDGRDLKMENDDDDEDERPHPSRPCIANPRGTTIKNIGKKP